MSHTAPGWIGHLPGEWKLLKLKFVASTRNSNVDKKSYEDGVPVRLCNYTDVYHNEFITADMRLMTATATRAEIERFSLQKNDVVITKDSESWDDIAVPALVAEPIEGGVCGYHLAMLRCGGKLDGRYLFRAMQATGVRDQFWVAANGVTRFGLGQYGLKNALLPCPPLSAQYAIANFLDRKTAAIDALIEKKERLIALLAEKRAALIHQAVTKGLDPSVRMKDSGVPWIGEIPAHWEVKRLRQISPRLTVGVVVNPSSYVSDTGVIPFIYGANISPGSIDESRARRISTQAGERLSKTRLNADDLVTVRVGEPGVTSVVPDRLEGANCASVMIIRRGRYDSRWLEAAMNSEAGRVNVDLVAYGAAQKQFNIGHAVDFVFPVPPRVEQKSIADWASEQQSAFSELKTRIAAQVARLREYRQALITAAVIGQLEIPGEG